MDPAHLNKLFSISNWLFLIPCYCQNSIGDLWNTLVPTSIWFLNLKKVATFEELANAFVQQYKYNSYLAPNRSNYHIHPPLDESEVTDVFFETLSSFYSEKMLGCASQKFTDMVDMCHHADLLISLFGVTVPKLLSTIGWTTWRTTCRNNRRTTFFGYTSLTDPFFDAYPHIYHISKLLRSAAEHLLRVERAQGLKEHISYFTLVQWLADLSRFLNEMLSILFKGLFLSLGHGLQFPSVGC